MRLTLRSVFITIIIPFIGASVLLGCGKKGPPLPPLPVKGAQLEHGALRTSELQSKGFVRAGVDNSASKKVFFIKRDEQHLRYKGSI